MGIFDILRSHPEDSVNAIPDTSPTGINSDGFLPQGTAKTDRTPQIEKTEIPFGSESFIREMDAAPTFLELLQITDRIDPARFTQEEYDALWGTYCRNRDRWPDEPYPATGWGTLDEADEATLPGTGESGLSGQEPRHPERITHSLGWDGGQMVLLPVCRDCINFLADSINPREGLGHCRSFPSPYNPEKHAIRYPMQDPKTESCFEREASR